MSRNLILNRLLEYNKFNSLESNIWGDASLRAALGLIKHKNLHFEFKIIEASKNCFVDSLGNGSYETQIFTENQDSHFSDKFTSEQTEYFAFCALDNITLHNWNGYHIIRDIHGQVYENSSAYSPLYEIWGEFNHTIIPFMSLDSAFLLFDDSDPNNYCHFLSEYIAKLYVYMKMNLKIPVILPPGLLKNFQLEIINLLKSFGICFVELPENTIFKINKIICLNKHSFQIHPFFRGNYNILSYMNSLIFDKNFIRNNCSNLLWISRSNSRKIINENVILDQLEANFNITKIDLASISVSQQAKLFAQNKYIIGPHGAAFTNLVFSAPGTIACEIFAPPNGTVAFAIISKSLNIHHHSYFGVNLQTGLDNYPDIAVNVQTFTNYFAEVFQ